MTSDMSSARRRWTPQFGLRALLACMVLAAVLCHWWKPGTLWRTCDASVTWEAMHRDERFTWVREHADLERLGYRPYETIDFSCEQVLRISRSKTDWEMFDCVPRWGGKVVVMSRTDPPSFSSDLDIPFPQIVDGYGHSSDHWFVAPKGAPWVLVGDPWTLRFLDAAFVAAVLLFAGALRYLTSAYRPWRGITAGAPAYELTRPRTLSASLQAE
jgi:hypothetical protein